MDKWKAYFINDFFPVNGEMSASEAIASEFPVFGNIEIPGRIPSHKWDGLNEHLVANQAFKVENGRIMILMRLDVYDGTWRPKVGHRVLKSNEEWVDFASVHHLGIVGASPRLRAYAHGWTDVMRDLTNGPNVESLTLKGLTSFKVHPLDLKKTHSQYGFEDALRTASRLGKYLPKEES